MREKTLGLKFFWGVILNFEQTSARRRPRIRENLFSNFPEKIDFSVALDSPESNLKLESQYWVRREES